MTMLIKVWPLLTLLNRELNVYHYDMRDQVNLTPDWETESSKKIQLIQHLGNHCEIFV